MKEELDDIMSFIKSLQVKKEGRLVESKEKLKTKLYYLSDNWLLFNKDTNYPCISEETKKCKNELNDKYGFLQYLIILNNKLKGRWTDIMIESLLRHKDKYLPECLKVLTETYRKNNFDKELLIISNNCMDEFKFTGEFNNWIRNRNNQIMFYNLLTKGGLMFYKPYKIINLLSFFVSYEVLNEEKYNTLLKNKDYKEDTISIMNIPSNEELLEYLLETKYLNKKHFSTNVRLLKDRDFYIPKKKRRKRIYTEDKDYYEISISYFNELMNNTSKVLIHSSFDMNAPKLVRSKNNRGRKIYVPKQQEPRIQEYYALNNILDEDNLKKFLSKLLD